jgi:hypothetical protein
MDMFNDEKSIIKCIYHDTYANILDILLHFLVITIFIKYFIIIKIILSIKKNSKYIIKIMKS